MCAQGEPIRPSPAEMRGNSRARSARLYGLRPSLRDGLLVAEPAPSQFMQSRGFHSSTRVHALGKGAGDRIEEAMRAAAAKQKAQEEADAARRKKAEQAPRMC